MKRIGSGSAVHGRRRFLRNAACGLAALPAVLLAGCGYRRSHTRPNFILITLDTTRVDRLSCYGYERPTTPNLDRLAAESTFYRDAYSTSSWTLPSHASLFTGKFVTSHGARYHPEGAVILSSVLTEQSGLEAHRANTIADSEMTLAQLLRQSGYATGAVVAGPWLKRVFKLDKGFTFYDDSGITSLQGRPAPSVTASAISWLGKEAENAFLLFLNYFDPHAPYAVHEEFVRKYVPSSLPLDDDKALSPSQAMLVRNAMYDSEVNFVDAAIGGLLEGLREQGLYDSTCIVVTSDHGELLGEHGAYGHGISLYQELIRVPLFIKHAKGDATPHESDTRIQLLDLFPMVLDAAGLSTPAGIQGDLPDGERHPIIAETYPLNTVSPRGSYQCLVEGEQKLILNDQGHHQLFDIVTDPQEQHNLLTQLPERAQEMESRLSSYLAGLPQPVPKSGDVVVDPETGESLRNLGYAG